MKQGKGQWGEVEDVRREEEEEEEEERASWGLDSVVDVGGLPAIGSLGVARGG